MNTGKDGNGIFQNQQTNRTRWHLAICNSTSRTLFSADERPGDCKLENLANVKEISVPNGKRGLPLEADLRFPNGFSGKVLFHLTFDQNYRIFCQMVSTQCIYAESPSPLTNSGFANKQKTPLAPRVHIANFWRFSASRF